MYRLAKDAGLQGGRPTQFLQSDGSCFWHRGSRRKQRQEHGFQAGGASQVNLLRKLSRRLRPGISRILSDSPFAGQQQEYLKNQVQAFVERRRTNNIMFHVSHVLSPAMLTALADNFHDLNPKPLTTAAPSELLASGKKIYDEGIPKMNVPPCASCHGPEAKGDGQFPRLAGQLSDYVVSKLKNWTKERGQESEKSRCISHHAADRARSDRTADQSRRRLSEPSGVSPSAVQPMKLT